jgi:hypothetical protein
MQTRPPGTPAICTSLWLSCALLGVSVCSAQSRPAEDCKFAHDGFATSSGQEVQIAEVKGRFTTQLEVCGSPKGCVEAPVAQGIPVQIYRRQGAWTCGYVSGHDGAGPAWISTDALSIVHYSDHPSLSAWIGAWVGGEDHVTIRLADKPGALHLAGSAVWQGEHTSHLGDTKGMATPVANHLHFVESGPGSCTIDLTLLDRYILAEDNQACGGLNARFQGIWKRVGR